MPASKNTDESRTQTDKNLRTERERSDDELRARSNALSEEADELMDRTRGRAQRVLDLAREREDRQLFVADATAMQRASVQTERTVADATLAAERATADSVRLDERERREAALLQLLALERSATDTTLSHERMEADRSLGAREDLLAIVAHDLRNMLSMVVINSSIIVVSTQLQAVMKPAAQIQRISAQMVQLLEDLLDFSGFEAGKLTIQRSRIDVMQVVAHAVGVHDEVAAANGVELKIGEGPRAVVIGADAKRLTRLLLNLIGNALKFTPSGGRISVTVSVDTECEIAVTDSGIGIPPDQLQSIFERFQQVHAQPRRSTGVGLGLYIARLIAEAHGGRIWAENGPSGGATFRVRLPITE